MRFGLGLIVVSWLPIAQALIWIGHKNGQLNSKNAANEFRLIVWSVQIVIGLVGVWLVGKLAVAAVKKDGIRSTPANLWQLFRYGEKAE